MARLPTDPTILALRSPKTDNERSQLIQTPAQTVAVPHSAVHDIAHLLAPFFLLATTLKFPLLALPELASSRLPSLPGPFLATSLQPPLLSAPALAGLALFVGKLVSTSPLSASFLRLMNSSAKCRESIVVEAWCTASVIMSAS